MEDQCCHRVFLEGKCTSCQKLIIDCKDVSTKPVNYIHGGLSMSLTISAVDRFRDRNLRVVVTRRKLNLILDLDNTLLNSKRTRRLTLEDKQRVTDNPKDLYKIEDESRMVKLRPGVREFLKKARDMFELSIYTMGTRDYAHTMAELLADGSGLDGYWSMFPMIISKEDCTQVGKKGLDVVLSSERVVLIVDDREDVWEDSCKGNVVKIEPYWFFQDKKVGKKVNNQDYGLGHEEAMDGRLRRVLDTLSKVHSMFYEDNSFDQDYMKRDVRQILKIVCVNEERKRREEEEAEISKRLREAQTRAFIERFCAPVMKKRKIDAAMAANSTYLV